MATDFRSLSLPIPGGHGTKVVEDTAIFSGTVVRADTAVKSFLFDYSSSDHHINVVEATTSVIGISGNAVRIRVVCRYADQNFDDDYTGAHPRPRACPGRLGNDGHHLRDRLGVRGGRAGWAGLA